MASRLPLIEIYADDSDEHRWRLVARNGRTIADSAEGYNTRHKARRAVTGVLAAFGVDANGEGNGPSIAAPVPCVTIVELD